MLDQDYRTCNYRRVFLQVVWETNKSTVVSMLDGEVPPA